MIPPVVQAPCAAANRGSIIPYHKFADIKSWKNHSVGMMAWGLMVFWWSEVYFYLN
jgi:hypothetical protein